MPKEKKVKKPPKAKKREAEVTVILATSMSPRLLISATEEAVRKYLGTNGVLVVSAVAEASDPLISIMQGDVINITSTIKNVVDGNAKTFPSKYPTRIAPNVEITFAVPPGGGMIRANPQTKKKLESLYGAMINEAGKRGVAIVAAGLIYSPWIAPMVKYASSLIFVGDGKTEELLGLARYLQSFGKKYPKKTFKEVVIRMRKGRKDTIVLAVEPFIRELHGIKSALRIEVSGRGDGEEEEEEEILGEEELEEEFTEEQEDEDFLDVSDL